MTMDQSNSNDDGRCPHHRQKHPAGPALLTAAILAAGGLIIFAGCEQRVVGRSGLGSDQVVPTTHEPHSDDTFSEWFSGEEEDESANRRW